MLLPPIHEEVKLAPSCCCSLAVMLVLPAVVPMTLKLAVASGTVCCRAAGSGLIRDECCHAVASPLYSDKIL